MVYNSGFVASVRCKSTFFDIVGQRHELGILGHELLGILGLLTILPVELHCAFRKIFFNEFSCGIDCAEPTGALFSDLFQFLDIFFLKVVCGMCSRV